MHNKILFLDRDGTLIDEPNDKQVDSLEKFKLKSNVIPALLHLKNAGFDFVMVSNQDGLATAAFPMAHFAVPQKMLLDIFESQGIFFKEVLICPHFEHQQCGCRKPKMGLLAHYLQTGKMDVKTSYVIGDRKTDLQLAQNMGIKGILYEDGIGWENIAHQLSDTLRYAQVHRKTKETDILVQVNLNECAETQINTGIGFFDHMLEQMAKHGGFGLQLNVQGDLHIDEHHTVEDTALTLGQALKEALGDKKGIARYGFLLPMDEALTQIALDLSGRGYFVFSGIFGREKVGDFPTELVPHFFRSLADGLGAALHIQVTGENTHHMIESIFKGVGRALRSAMRQEGNELPTTKGVL